MQPAVAADEPPPRPWVDNYPPGIAWQADIDLTPVHEQVLGACTRTPSALALDFLGSETSFGELGEAIRGFAGALQAEFGVTKGTRVALMLPNTPFYVIAYYGVLLAGGTVVNCNPLYTVEELAHITGNSGAEILVTLDLKQTFPKAEKLVAGGQVKRVVVCAFWRALGLGKGVLFRVAKASDVADVASSAIAGQVSWLHQLLAHHHAPSPVAIDPLTDVAVQQYTGGTTGQPKGAMLSHANIAANMSQIDHWAQGLFNPPSRVVAVLPFFHIFSMTACMNVPLCKGAAVVMLPRFELKALLDLIERTGANILLAVPTLIQALAHSSRAQQALKSLEIAVTGGAPLPDELHHKWARVSSARLAEGYGLTEASPVVCCAALKVESRSMSIGQPLPMTDIRIASLEDPRKSMPLGERGELLVRGPQVMLGYYGDAAATDDVFCDGYLRTGDVGYLDEAGYVYLVDRIKDLIICSGFNIYPRVIEEALYLHPKVDEASVIGVADAYRGEAPVAFVKLRESEEATTAELKAFLGDRLNKLEMPREIIFKSQLPKTLIGKLSKKELREEYAAMKARNNEPA
jgi:long-chain acyl-CoA synthetase